MLVQHRQHDNRGMFFVGMDGAILAEMVYTLPSDTRMIIEHTEVSEELRGRDVGFHLVEAAVEYARVHGMTIIPLCPFAYSVFQKRADFHDVMAENYK
ncbi:N-acetyltransferase [Flavihumibacter rivuli]|uniref:GNAT family N-acetyltransferase n=1 Tax=Flavihumibacter rivuli TaxID=2838156 RepID=UPI001BDE2B1D|nr:GNAT family N-acetyltransferase [Flavihumibacter rivuli]ULQ57222.1 N-acetyltransferase [Flavihumibacter rivuli]